MTILMPGTVQEYLAAATNKAADDLWDAFSALPAEARDEKPAPSSRSALNLLVECTLLNGYTADLIRTHRFSDTQMSTYGPDSDALTALAPDALRERLRTNTHEVIAAIRATPDEAFALEIVMPWNTQTLGQIVAYPYWNMSYHLGQINYIASLRDTAAAAA